MSRGRPHRLLTLVQIASMQKRRAMGEKYEVLVSAFNTTKQMVWYFTKGPGRIQRGICRYCFCTERTPCLAGQICICDPKRRADQVGTNPYCKFPHAGQLRVPCAWLDDSKTVCSSYKCRIAHQGEQQRQESN
jgi:hypothetical protein